MPLKHADIWQAIDNLAKREGLSTSGLAKKAGLSPTVFNPSKRLSDKRKRWPSTESIAQILQATNTPLDDFVALAVNDTARTDIPLATWADAQQAGMFEDGAPVAVKWSALRFPVVNDARAFALEITGAEFGPLYRDGDRIVISPAEKPRRGDRVLVRLRTGELKLGQLGRDTAQKIELASFASGQSDISRTAIEWIYRILWASQ